MAEAELDLEQRPPDPRMAGIIKLAIMAVGGQGGGVLTDWVEACARAGGYAVQATSVAGVAQRTGATIYYIEMAPASERAPVFSLMPAAGDVDVLIAAEMMEAGRAIMRGFVTPDRTTLIASSHRALAVSEKTVPGDGIASSDEVVAAAEIAAQRFIAFDMEKIAVECGTVISASLFGALAGSKTLPFRQEDFEAAIRASGRGVEASLAAFTRARAAVETPPAEDGDVEPAASPVAAPPRGPEKALQGWTRLMAEINGLPGEVRDMARQGLRAVVDFQDIDYGREYLDRLGEVLSADDPDRGYLLSCEAAKYIANAMAYDDVIRVADLKTRESRLARVRREMKPPAGTRLMVTEFLHPRAEEIVGLLPARLGRWVEARPARMRFVDRLVNRGRRLRSDRFLPFLQLYAVAGLRRWRRGNLRHAVEQAHLEAWLDDAFGQAAKNYDLAVELIRNRRLIKGYSDTHARGLGKFERVRRGIALIEDRADAADWARRLRTAALADEKGAALDGVIATIRSFSEAE